MPSIFTKIMNGTIPGEILYQDEVCVAIRDIQPQAPQHILIVPRQEIPSIAAAKAADQEQLGHLLLTAAKVADILGFAKDGYRLVINTGRDGGQTVDHLHIHLLAGRPLKVPLG